MNLQAARLLHGASRMACPCQRSSAVALPSRQRLRTIARVCRSHCTSVCPRDPVGADPPASGSANPAAANLAAAARVHLGQRRLRYSTGSTPDASAEKPEASDSEVTERTAFPPDGSAGAGSGSGSGSGSGGSRRTPQGKMKSYVRKASEATEKMKERVADTVKDMNENILTVPNLLSTTRLVLSPVLGYLVIQECYTVGACLFAVAGITDLLDGFIARNFKNQQSVLGSIIDPLADKCLVAILTLSLTVSGLIPVPLTVLMVSRDVGLVGSVLYLRYQSLPPPRTISRFFDVTHATIQLKPTAISKLNTAVQLGLVGFTLIAPVFHFVDHPLLHALWYTTAATTIISGLSYAFCKDAFKYLRKR